MLKKFRFRREIHDNNTKNLPYIDSLIASTSSKSLMNRFLIGCILVSCGILLAESGGSWDITNHLLNKPETFFSTPHVVLYSGIAFGLAGASIMFLNWKSYSIYISTLENEKKIKLNLAIKLVISGVFMLILAGPLDFSWHSTFGLDGLLSPPHFTLTIGMLAGSIGSLIGVISYITVNNSLSRENQQNIDKVTFKNNKKTSIIIYMALIIIGILPVWMSSSGLIYMFSLPFSDTEYYNFNLHPIIAAIIATISFPFLISFILISLFKLGKEIGNKKRKFGIVSVTGLFFIIITIITMIIPNKSLISTIPFYILTIIPIMIADMLLSKLPLKKISIYISGGILGASFFMLYYPLITHIYNEVFSNQPVWPNITAPIYFDMFSQIYPLLVVPSIGMGVLGIIISNKLIDRKIKKLDSTIE